MKVVMIKDVKGTGRANHVVEVKDGHAINFLIPRKMAIPATAEAVKRAETMQKQFKERQELDDKLIAERLTALAEERIVFIKKANEQGHLYDAVDAKEIAAMTQLPVDAISIERPFKELGTFDVPVAYGENFGKITIVVEAE
ncbi:MAG: 50S ribosomal protein L9 [Candidatus Pacebacteria bacterium]|nr:50S ribosomal protein L9 [Candidatus Paceibacterota bacterium]